MFICYIILRERDFVKGWGEFFLEKVREKIEFGKNSLMLVVKIFSQPALT